MRSVAIAVIAAAAAVLTGAATSAAEPFHIDPAGDRALSTPPTTSFCLANLGIHC